MYCSSRSAYKDVLLQLRTVAESINQQYGNGQGQNNMLQIYTLVESHLPVRTCLPFREPQFCLRLRSVACLNFDITELDSNLGHNEFRGQRNEMQ